MRFNPRIVLAFAHDVVAAGVAWVLAYLFRFNFEMPAEFQAAILKNLPWLLPLHTAIFWRLGLYRGMWRFASLNDLRRIIFAASLAAALVTICVYMAGIRLVPRSVLLLYPLILLLLMGGSRFMYRTWKEHRLLSVRDALGKPVLVLGAGEAAHRLLRELSMSTEWSVVGLLDDNATIHGRSLSGYRILGAIDKVAEIRERFDVQHAIIAMPNEHPAARRKAAELAANAGLTVLTVPAYDDLLAGRVAISQVRKVELEDLLGRERVDLDDAGLHTLLTDKVVLVTGAGGSIGSELCRQIAVFKPAHLILFELSEFALYRIEQEFAESYPSLRISCVVGDVKDARRLDRVFAQVCPDIVFHAAAYKHVPLMESENAWEAIRNNVVGTWCVGEAARRHMVKKFVLVSTDKAVNPTNIMGASKRLAERVCQLLQQGAETRFIVVRFGNVLGSNGSVIPRFREQISRGGPVTVTHPDIIRYFMLIPEAAQLVLQAGLMGLGGEIFVLDMGEPIKIADLARDMIHLSGFSDQEIKIVFTGLRPGEKLYEELLADNELTLQTPHSKLRVARAEAAPDRDWQAQLEEWLQAEAPESTEIVRADLSRFVPEYAPAIHGN